MAGDIEVDYSQLEAFSKRMAVMANGGFEQKVATAVQQAGQSLVTAVKSLTPVKSGSLRRQWRLTKIGYGGGAFTVTLSNGAEYASFVESGHRQKVGQYVPAIGKRLVAPWVEGSFMMRDGVKAGMPAATRIIDKGVQQALEEVFGGK